MVHLLLNLRTILFDMKFTNNKMQRWGEHRVEITSSPLEYMELSFESIGVKNII